MNRLYHQSYYEEHFLEANGGLYEDRSFWYPFFDRIAERLTAEFAPETVLDAGCAFGYLVEAFRKRGIAAYGIDLSDYSISYAAPEIREYCIVQSVTEPMPQQFPKHFDLIVSIEVLEHLTAEEGETALKNLCGYTDTVVFSSTDSDLNDPTHVNVQRKEYWARIFAQYSFFRDIQFPAPYISANADIYRRRYDLENVIQEYEIMLRIEKDNKRPVGRQSLLYCDTGNGFREEEKIEINRAILGEQIRFSVELPEQVKRIRFDPVEGCYCILSGLKVFLGETETEAVPVNAAVMENTWIFDTVDPQIMIERKTPGKLTVEGTVVVAENIPMNLSVLLGLLRACLENREPDNIIQKIENILETELKRRREEELFLKRRLKTYGWRK